MNSYFQRMEKEEACPLSTATERHRQDPPHPKKTPKRNHKYTGLLFNPFLLIAFVVCALACGPLGTHSLYAQEDLKESILNKYEEAIILAEELNLYQQDILHVIPKIRHAGDALLRNDFREADKVLDTVLDDLKLLRSKKPSQIRIEVRLEWLEIYADVVQKYGILAILAFLFIRWPFFMGKLRKGKWTAAPKVYLSLITAAAAIACSLFDTSRYGESAWAFLDIQLVILTAGGLLAGLWPGFFAGLIVGAFRWVLHPEYVVYFALAIMAGCVGGLMHRRIKDFTTASGNAFVTGLAVGGIHGIVLYLPTVQVITWFFFIFSIGLLAILEGIGVFIFFAVLSGILRDEQRRDLEKELLTSQLLFLQAQMKPHFLFNALNAISAICRREKAEKARHLVLSLSDFLRRSVKRIDQKIPLKEEISYIDSYLEIEKVRFENHLKVEKQIELRKESWEAMIPILVLQPLVENAIKHGISKKEGGGTLIIKLSDKNGGLKVDIKDDGVGMTEDEIKDILEGRTNSKHEQAGIGLRNIQERLRRFYGNRSQIHFESEVGKGTRVTLNLPLQSLEKEERG